MRLPKWIWFAPIAIPVVAVLLAPQILRVVGGGFYSQPGQSMIPALPEGSAYLTLPISADDLPARGAIIVFAHPQQPDVDHVSRLIGLPGDTISMSQGAITLNGAPVARQQLDPIMVELPRTQKLDGCETSDTQVHLCPVAAWQETLDNGHQYRVLDLRPTAADDLAELTVPEGHVFVMGDHRDNSLDSRFPGMGMVPVGNLKSTPWRFHFNINNPGVSLSLFLGAVDPQP